MPIPLRPPSDLDDLIEVARKLDPEDQLRLVSTLWDALSPSQRAALGESDLPALLDRSHSSEPPPRRVYSAPRRFDLATIFVVTFAYSLLFGAMKALSFPSMVSVSIAGFISFVGAGQALFFGGKQPRTASLVAGALFYSVVVIAAWLINGPRAYTASIILLTASYTIVAGAILGYLSGTFVGGVFLIADKLRLRLSRNRHAYDEEPSIAIPGGTIDPDSPQE